jgi:hypothetical protein
LCVVAQARSGLALTAKSHVRSVADFVLGSFGELKNISNKSIACLRLDDPQ